MTKTKLTKIIKMAKESTEEVWGFIKREGQTDEYPPTGQQPVDGEEWKQQPDKITKFVIDNVAWRTYESVLSILLKFSSGNMEELIQLQHKLIEDANKVLGEFKKDDKSKKNKENNDD